jgi:CCR4-NOT transcriptional complex subunit CAF120
MIWIPVCAVSSVCRNQYELTQLYLEGRPCPDRQWVECYAQLIGTVLSVWDAAALDAAPAGEEVPSTFINLTDASIRVVSTR